MSSSSRSTVARRSSRGPSNTCVLTARRGPARGCSTSGKDRAPDDLGNCGGQAGFTPAVPIVHVCLRACRGEIFWKSHPREDEQPRRRSRPGDEKEPSGSFSYLPQIHLVELLDAGGGGPAAQQAGRASGLARVRKARLDLLAEDLFDVDLEGRLQAAKAPRLGGFVRRPGLRERQRVARARPRRIQRDASDYTVVGMKAVWDVGVEGEDDIGFRG